MTREERRLRPEHHVVHDYANLVSVGRLRQHWRWKDVKLGELGPVTGHLWHVFYLNCRKSFEFFTYKHHDRYLRACDFIESITLPYQFKYWTMVVQTHMEGHIMHYGDDRTKNEVEWTGKDDMLYLADFEAAWRVMMGDLKGEHKDIFRDEIDDRLREDAFHNCGTLGKEFIL
jgi:hypothetical protein